MLRGSKGCSEDKFSSTKYMKILELLKEYWGRRWASFGHYSWDRVLWPGNAKEPRQEPLELGWQLTPAFLWFKGPYWWYCVKAVNSWEERYHLKEYLNLTKIVLNNIYLSPPMPKNSPDNNLDIVIQFNVCFLFWRSLLNVASCFYFLTCCFQGEFWHNSLPYLSLMIHVQRDHLSKTDV